MNPAPWRLEWARRFAEHEVCAQFVDVPRATTPEIESLISKAWERESRLNKERPVFNGTLGRLVSADATSSILQLKLGTTCFRDFLATNALRVGNVDTMGVNYLANPLGISTLVVTSDDYLVLGRRSENVRIHAGYVHPFGGMVEADDARDDIGYDVFAAANRELTEETAIGKPSILELSISGLIEDRALRQPEMLFEVSVALSTSELKQGLSRASDSDEHVSVASIRADKKSMVSFLNSTTRVTPVTSGALLVFGLHRWGNHWFDEACSSLYGCHVKPSLNWGTAEKT